MNEDWRGKTPQGHREDTTCDWYCSGCSTRNFAKRPECFKCGRPNKPNDYGAPEDAARDWFCLVCSARNFNRRTKCMECGGARGERGRSRSRSRTRDGERSFEGIVSVEPPNLDFVQRLFGDESMFCEHVAEYHRCEATFDGEEISLRGQGVPALKRRLNGMFQLNAASQQALLEEYRVGQWSNVEIRDDDGLVTSGITKAFEAQQALRIELEKTGPSVRANLDLLLRLAGGNAEVTSDGRALIASGTVAEVEKISELMRRVKTHCAWGVSEQKVARILDPPELQKATLLRLSPMSSALPNFATTMSGEKLQVAIGKDASRCEVFVNDAMVSRIHCVIDYVYSNSKLERMFSNF